MVICKTWTGASDLGAQLDARPIGDQEVAGSGITSSANIKTTSILLKDKGKTRIKMEPLTNDFIAPT